MKQARVVAQFRKPTKTAARKVAMVAARRLKTIRIDQYLAQRLVFLHHAQTEKMHQRCSSLGTVQVICETSKRHTEFLCEIYISNSNQWLTGMIPE